MGSTEAESVPEPSEITMFQCCWCKEYDNENNLHAAGQKWAKKKPDPVHIQNITHKWKLMAVALCHEHVLQLLSMGDVSSNELFYHAACLNSYTKKYNNIKNIDNNDDNNAAWIKELVLNKIILHINDLEVYSPGNLFIVGELESMYIEMLDGHDIVCTSHVSRFAEHLLERVPGLHKGISGNKLSLFFDSAVQNIQQNHEDFFDALRNVIGPVRQAMLEKCKASDKTLKFDKASQINSVPIELLTLVNFILEGVNLTDKGFSKESLAISQIMQFNFRSNRDEKKLNTKKRHDQSKETPFPLYAAVKMYTHSRSKTMINWLYYSGGISISYDRLLSFTTDLANKMLCQYEAEGVFLPCNLRKNIFTIVAKDNIDVNARSTTASKHYHGTSFSIFQFPTKENPGDRITYPEAPPSAGKANTSKKLDRLPTSYTEVRKFLLPSTSLFFLAAPCPKLPDPESSVYKQGLKDEYEWLESAYDAEKSVWVPWAKHHSSKKRTNVRSLDISAIIPPIDEPVHTLDMQFHCMELIIKIINALNPGQIACDTADQPIFKLTKELQIKFPELFGPDKYFCIFGSLHIEKSILIILGKLIEKSGLDAIMLICGLSIVGADSLVTVNDIKRARYCLQVAACVIYLKLKDAYKDSGSDKCIFSWLDERCKSSEMCVYWKTILKLMIEILVLIRSIREGNYVLYVASLRKIISWYFSMDHFNYARWISVHLHDLYSLPENSPQLHKYFMDGYFTFQKTDHKFSLMGLDQIHEQNNAIMKGMGGVSSSLNKVDESSMARWGLCIHELASIVNDYEFEETDSSSDHESQCHHEDSAAFQKRFTADIKSLNVALVSNPFLLERLTVLNNHDKAKFNDRVIEDIRVLESNGEKQFHEFWTNRLQSANIPISETISLNSYNLPGNYNGKSEDEPVMSAVMMAKFIEAGKNRRHLIENVLNTEVFGICQSLAQDQYSLYHGTKSNVISCLVHTYEEVHVPSDAMSGCVIELSMLLRKNLPAWVHTFADYSKFLYDQIMDISSSFKRCDVVIDQYFDNSLKEGTRKGRGSDKGLVIKFDDMTHIPSNFLSKFLTNSINKTNLNEFLVKKFISHHHGKQQILCVTSGDEVISNSDVSTETDITRCSAEEADPRIIRHVINLGKKGYTNVHVKTIDSDVVMLCLTYVDHVIANGIEKFIVIYGPKKKKIDIIYHLVKFGSDICNGFSFFHAFTGCDTVSSFYRIGKAKFWDVWQSKVKAGSKDLTNIFKRLSNTPTDITLDDFNGLCQFVYEAYGLTKQTIFKSQRTNQLVTTPNINLRILVPSPSGILQQIKRACLQAGYVWKLSVMEVNLPDPIEWGWMLHEDGALVPRWQDEPATNNIKSVISTCSCVKGVCQNCSCKKSSMKCLIYCKCDKTKCKNI